MPYETAISRPHGLLLFASRGLAQSTTTVSAEVDAVYPQSEALYFDLHRNPELSRHEQHTAAKLAAGLLGLGYAVTTGVGGTGVVGILKNGDGPVVMLRTELDALPVEADHGDIPRIDEGEFPQVLECGLGVGHLPVF